MIGLIERALRPRDNEMQPIVADVLERRACRASVRWYRAKLATA